MKKATLFLLTIALSMATQFSMAQTPTDFVQGSITLANGTKQDGFIKDNMAKKGDIQFMNANNSKKINYDGIALSALQFSNTSYQCIKGDFFKIICSGKICFLEKVSKTSNKILYSGSDPIGVAGTEGKIGDYYLYKNNTLQLLTKKNAQNIISTELKDCPNTVLNVNTENLSTVAEIITAYNKCI